METDYKPISCDFHSILEDHAARRRYIQIQYFTEIREFIRTQAIIKDIYTLDGEEYLKLNTGEEIRLDKIVKVDDQLAPGFEHFEDYSCDC